MTRPSLLSLAMADPGPHQIPLAQTCPVCGRTIHPLHELADLSDQAVAALESRRLAIPQIVPDALKTLANDLRCLAGACGGPT